MSTEKTEEQVAKDKAAVDAMRNARANMDAALNRISDLERALTMARERIAAFKKYVPTGAYTYEGRKTLHAEMDEAIEAITKRLGT